ncbi:hypothetical protein pb186bvf_020833 [Paramecium bursaria]
MILIFQWFTFLQQLVDYCKQLDQFELCIGSTLSKCRWNTNFQQCSWSNNYLYGCERTLNKNLCLNQIGNLRTGDCKSIFNNQCQEFEDFKKISSSNPLNRGACLSVTKEKEYCQWDNKCIQLNDQKEFIQTILLQGYKVILQICVRAQIDNYVIINSFLLKNKLNIQNLIYEAENKISVIINLKHPMMMKEQGYQYNEKKKKIALNDPNRYCCIAEDIPDDTVDKQLFSFGEDDIIYGYNHVYCFELEFSMATTDTEGKEQSDKKVTYFMDDACHIIKQNLLQDVEYIRANNIQCKNLGKVGCLSIKKQCILKKYSQIEQSMPQEFPCDDYKSCDSQNTQTFSYFECAKTDLNYMDLSSIEAPCFDIWQSENSFMFSTQIGKGVYGIKRLYLFNLLLKNMLKHSYFFLLNKNAINLVQVKFIEINYMIPVIGMNNYILKIDQHCAWLDNECRNIRLSHYLSFDPKTFMNRNLCFYQDGPYESVEKCQKIEKYEVFRCDKLTEKITTNTQQCTSRQINKYACLNIRKDPNVWLPYYQQCYRYTLLELPVCDLTILAQFFMIVKVSDNKLCLQRIHIRHQIKCSDPVLRKVDCLKVTTPGCIVNGDLRDIMK